MKTKKKIIGIFLFLAGAFGGLFFWYAVNHSRGLVKKETTFTIEKGEGVRLIAQKLEKAGLIKNKYYFVFYTWSRNLASRILPGEYVLSGQMTIPDISSLITQPRNQDLKITFPEGWTSKQMSQRLANQGFSGDEFLRLVENPQDFKEEFSFLEEAGAATLEGYLFPETYFFSKEMNAHQIIRKMLSVFEKNFNSQIKQQLVEKDLSLNEVIIMASLIEGEVRSERDRKIVSGIFWKRLREKQPLQSCATLAYVTGERKRQYSEKDTKIQSPFNTYLNLDLPPTPISNPGLSAILAALNPESTDFRFFLSDLESGETVFSKNYEEHLSNKAKYGL